MDIISELLLLICLFAVVTHTEMVLQLPDTTLRPDLNVYRQMVIRNNVMTINQHNSNPDKTYTMEAYPQFVGLTRQEFKARFIKNHQGILPVDIKVNVPSSKELQQLRLRSPRLESKPQTVDWSLICSTVYNQGQCGNCYAFSSVETVNCYYAVRNKNVPKLSIQQLTDCSDSTSLKQHNLGCDGGNPAVSMWYIAVYGLVQMEAYPLNPLTLSDGKTQPCQETSSKRYHIENWYTVQTTDCSAQVMLLSYGFPLTTAMYADTDALIYYKKGIISGCDPVESIQLDHAIMMVGFGKNGTHSYIKIKNSWGTNWGEGGYFRISMFNNELGICYFSVSPYN